MLSHHGAAHRCYRPRGLGLAANEVSATGERAGAVRDSIFIAAVMSVENIELFECRDEANAEQSDEPPLTFGTVRPCLGL